jgi:hypothetical protein
VCLDGGDRLQQGRLALAIGVRLVEHDQERVASGNDPTIIAFLRISSGARAQKGKDGQASVRLQLVTDEMTGEVGECARHHAFS